MNPKRPNRSRKRARLNTTRKRPRPVIPEEEPKEPREEIPYWSKFLKEGDVMFDYMIKNYNRMVNDNKIWGLEIFEIDQKFGSEIHYLEKNYLDEIQKELIPWIQNQYKTGQLFEKSNWKPFRDFGFTTFTLGYKVMFQYKQYYFQLSMDTDCPVVSGLDDEEYVWVSFLLALYGWKEDGKEKLQPDNDVAIPPDNIMPDWYWDNKY
jgi:hypothetical protein